MVALATIATHEGFGAGGDPGGHRVRPGQRLSGSAVGLRAGRLRGCPQSSIPAVGRPAARLHGTAGLDEAGRMRRSVVERGFCRFDTSGARQPGLHVGSSPCSPGFDAPSDTPRGGWWITVVIRAIPCEAEAISHNGPECLRAR
ncbi:hypothetical protein PSD17_34400 [Pseudonocardia sp. D17]|nr:hypothetical protein PSD17_34400 [Pseudonocardia sp. D17]